MALMAAMATDQRKLILCSPTERGEHMNVLRRTMNPVVSSQCEKRGADFLWVAGTANDPQWWGVQRKTIADLWRSSDDGRLHVELGQASTEIDHLVMVVEGRLQATVDGVFTAGRMSRSVGTHMKALMTLASHGLTVIQTESAQHTGFAVKAIVDWSREDKHSLGLVRPKASGKWGTATSREWSLHLMQSFPGIGADVAAKIVDAHGVPLKWTVTLDDLLKVPGVGRKRAQVLIEALLS